MTCEEFVDLLHTTNRRRRTLPSSSMSSFVKGQVGILEITYVFGKPRQVLKLWHHRQTNRSPSGIPRSQG